MTLRNQGLLDTNRTEILTNPQKLGQHTLDFHRFKSDRVSALKGEVDTRPTPNQESLCSWHRLAKGKWVLSNGVSPDMSTTLWLHAKEELNKNKFHGFFPPFVWLCFWVFCFILFCLTFFVLCLIDFFFFARELEHEVWWVGSWGGVEEKAKHVQNILYKKLMCEKSIFKFSYNKSI